MTEDEFWQEINSISPEPWENCLEEIESFIFGDSNVAARYLPKELVAAISYLEKSLRWKCENPTRIQDWQGSHEWERAWSESSFYAETEEKK